MSLTTSYKNTHKGTMISGVLGFIFLGENCILSTFIDKVLVNDLVHFQINLNLRRSFCLRTFFIYQKFLFDGFFIFDKFYFTFISSKTLSWLQAQLVVFVAMEWIQEDKNTNNKYPDGKPSRLFNSLFEFVCLLDCEAEERYLIKDIRIWGRLCLVLGPSLSCSCSLLGVSTQNY